MIFLVYNLVKVCIDQVDCPIKLTTASLLLQAYGKAMFSSVGTSPVVIRVLRVLSNHHYEYGGNVLTVCV